MYNLPEGPLSVVEIAGKRIAPKHPCFLIAEAGVNHNGDIDLAVRLIDAAADAGADAVKFQTFVADRLASRAALKAQYQRKTTGSDGGQREMLRKLELSESNHRQLIEHCRLRGITFLSTPFDELSSDLLESLNVPAFKLPSGELTNHPFLEHVAAKGRPVILSTGMADLDEVRAAVEAIRRRAPATPLVLLHCVSCYPASPDQANLKAMEVLGSTFAVPIGFSDHTEGREVSLAAAALGARVIEKHFTLDRRLPGPDHAFSLEPADLKDWVRGIRSVEAALGNGRKVPMPGEEDVARAARKSLVALLDIPPGTVLSRENVGAQRPGTGIAPSALGQVLGRKARRSIEAGTVLAFEMLE